MKLMCGNFGEPSADVSAQITEVKPTVQVTKLEAEAPILGTQSLKPSDPDASAGSNGMAYGIMDRLYNREPAMVAFVGDELENEIRAELAAWSDEDSMDFYYSEEEGGSSMMDSRAQAAAEIATAKMDKVSLTDIARAKEAEAQKPNKVLVYGGLAAVAAFLFFKE